MVCGRLSFQIVLCKAWSSCTWLLLLVSESKEDVSSSSVQVTVKKGVKRKADTTTPLSSDQVSFKRQSRIYRRIGVLRRMFDDLNTTIKQIIWGWI